MIASGGHERDIVVSGPPIPGLQKSMCQAEVARRSWAHPCCCCESCRIFDAEKWQVSIAHVQISLYHALDARH